MTWKIQALSGEFANKDIVIDRDTLVGRHQDAGIVLQSAEISRRHAAFMLKDQALCLLDLKSSNGTFVNDVRIDVETALQAGDTVRFASLAFAVLSEPAAVAEPVVAVIQTDLPATDATAIVQPSEAVATSAHFAEQTAETVVVETVAVKQVEAIVPAEAVVETIVVDAVVEAVVVEQREQVIQAAPVVEAVVVDTVAETASVEPVAVEPNVETVAESIAVEAIVKAIQPTAAQQLDAQGMLSVAERAAGTKVSKEGMPDHVAVPKPAPIPENIVVEAQIEPVAVAIPEPVSEVKQAEEVKKNTSVGLITIIVLLIVAVLAWLMFK